MVLIHGIVEGNFIDRDVMFKTLVAFLVCFGFEACGKKVFPKKQEVSVKTEESKTVDPIQFTYGNPKAPVTVVEYSSSACGACGYFKSTTWPEIKKNYVDAGKVFWVLKPFGFSGADIAAAHISYCHKNPTDLLETYYKTQEKWMLHEDPLKEVQAIARTQGMDQKDIDACLKKQDILNGLIACRIEAAELGIEATPTFLIGKTAIGQAIDFKDFSKILEKALKHVKKKKDLATFVHEGAQEKKPSNKRKPRIAHDRSKNKNQKRSRKK